MKGLGGTPGFMAPEIEKYVGKELYTDKVDSFSFGMYIYELVTLHQPFNDLNPAQVKQLIVEGHRPPLTAKVCVNGWCSAFSTEYRWSCRYNFYESALKST